MAHPLARIAANRLALNSRFIRLLHDNSKGLPLLSSCVFKSESSNSTPPKKVLSLSMILLQDGLDVEELPVIIRRTDKTMFPYTNYMYSGENIRPATVEDENFKYQLQKCSSVSEVFKLLEIPGDKVTGYSASYAVQRMCQLKEANDDWDDLDTFICTAVMNELYSTVRKEVSTLSNDTLHSLARCFLNSQNFSEQCAEYVQEEIEKRIGDSQFTILELCDLSNTLRLSPQYKELVHIIWVHIGSNYGQIDESNVARVVECLPRSYKYITRMIAKQTKRFWWNLSGGDIASVLSTFVKLNVFYGDTMQNVGTWSSLNIHIVKETDLIQILAAFIHFGFSDINFIRALERFLQAKGSKLETSLLALAMEYCRDRRYLSTRILDTAAMHFCDNGDSYSPLQLFSVLRPFGYLNYMPPKATRFLLKVEEVLSKELLNLEPVHIAELLCSFAYVKKTPVNFVKNVLNLTFLSKVKTLNQSQSSRVALWLEMFQSAVILETSAGVPIIFKRDMNIYRWKAQIIRYQEDRLLNILRETLGIRMVWAGTLARHSVYQIELEIHVKDRKAVTVKQKFNHYGKKDFRLALLIQAPDHYCINTHQLLGEYAMRNRHLALLGYTIVEMPQVKLASIRQPADIKKYLQHKLSPYMDFD